MVGVISDLRGQVKGHGEPRLPLLEQVFVARVRFLGGPETRVLAHRPEPPAVHGGLYASRVREFARQTKLTTVIGIHLIKRRIYAVDGCI